LPRFPFFLDRRIIPGSGENLLFQPLKLIKRAPGNLSDIVPKMLFDFERSKAGRRRMQSAAAG
jgi:hypothetical protein